MQFCRKKDKYPGFDFCGKRCAAQAAKTGQAVKRSTGGKGPLSGPLGNIINIYREAEVSLNNFQAILDMKREPRPANPAPLPELRDLAFRHVGFQHQSA